MGREMKMQRAVGLHGGLEGRMENQKRPRGRPKAMFKESSAGTLQSLDRALGLLVSVARAERATLTELSRELNIPTATTHRILSTLQKHGFAAFDEDRQEWMVGIEAYRTGAAFLKTSSVIEIGQPILRRLMRDTGETANLAVPSGSEVVFVGQHETQNPIRAFFPPGSRTSMHASGTGKAILAGMDEQAVARLLRDMALTRYTDNTHITLESLREDMGQIRRRGWSHDREERYSGMSCVGAAIFDDRGRPCAGISVSGPSARIEAGDIAGTGALVAAAAREITDLIGGRAPG